VEPGFFEVMRNALEGFVAGVDGRRNIYVHSRGLKVWFDDDTREHYESQLIRLDGEVQLEIGFHSEHPKAPQNDAVLRRLLDAEPVWRPELGDEAGCHGAALLAFDATPCLGDLRLPTLLMAARDDVLVPSSVSEELALAIEGSTLHIAPWGAHAVNVTQAESFNFLLLDFLDRHGGLRP